MLTRISLIVAIIAGLAVGTLNFVKVKIIITDLRTNLANEISLKEQALTKLAATEKDLETTKADLSQTKETLATTTAERDRAVQTAAEQTKKATDLAAELDTTKHTLNDTQAELQRYTLSGFTAEQVSALGKTLKQAQDDLEGAQQENKVLARKIEKLEYQLAKFRPGGPPPVLLPATLRGKIIVSDPKWDFVVLNVGEDQGVREDGELLVNRNGQLVAKVKVTSVQKDRCIANVMPGWKLGELLEGDLVIPAHPAS